MTWSEGLEVWSGSLKSRARMGLKILLTLIVWEYDIYHVTLLVQMVKNPPAMQETQVQSLHQDDPLEKRMGTHSSVLAWIIPWTEEPSWLQPVGCKKSDVTEQLTHMQGHKFMRDSKRHRCIERTFGLCGRRRGWDDLGEWH